MALLSTAAKLDSLSFTSCKKAAWHAHWWKTVTWANILTDCHSVNTDWLSLEWLTVGLLLFTIFSLPARFLSWTPNHCMHHLCAANHLEGHESSRNHSMHRCCTHLGSYTASSRPPQVLCWSSNLHQLNQDSSDPNSIPGPYHRNPHTPFHQSILTANLHFQFLPACIW